MTEKEKMLKEMLYNANHDKDLSKERAIAKDLCFKFNQLMPSDVENQKKLLSIKLNSYLFFNSNNFYSIISSL